jgi:lipopolysaccharide transport system ATP-binding protein
MSNRTAISAHSLGKRYQLGAAQQRYNSFREMLADRITSVFKRPRKLAGEEFWALRAASFEIARGENVGVIGLNGAGKSTLLKMLSRITEPSAGHALIEGRVGALLEVGTGFHSELTGRENVFLYGSILGMCRKEMRQKFDAIVEFSGLPQFIDTPVKRYSSGMYVRLAFSVAAHLEPDILLLDEVLAVGDLAFQRKCLEFARSLQHREATILFVSHNMFSIKTMCERVLYLRHGRLVFDGPTAEGIRLYEEDCHLGATGNRASEPNPTVAIKGFQLLDQHDRPQSIFHHGERLRIRLRLRALRPLKNPSLVIAIIRADQVACCNFSNEADGVCLGRVEGEVEVEVNSAPLRLVSELYTVKLLIWEEGFQSLLYVALVGSFHVTDPILDIHFGVFHEAAQWQAQAVCPPNSISPPQCMNERTVKAAS